VSAATRRRKAPAVPLADIVKTRMSRGQCWGAITRDREWGMDRLEDVGTTWQVVHKPTKTVVADFLGSLRQCRVYIASGGAREDLEQITAAAKGEGND
jgi:hypothetical protein